MGDLRYSCKKCNKSVNFINCVESYSSALNKVYFCNEKCHQEYLNKQKEIENFPFEFIGTYGVRFIFSGALTFIAFLLTHHA